MKLLVLTREFPPHVMGGLSYHLAYLYRELVDRGHAVTVVTGACGEATPAGADLVDDDIDVHTVPYRTFHAQHLTVPLKLWRFVRDFDVTRFDVAISHTPLPYELPIPTVGKYHDCPQAERPYFRAELGKFSRVVDSMLNPTRRFVDRRSLSAVDMAIFNSNLNRDAWAGQYGDLPPNQAVHNGVDPDVFFPRDVDGEYVLFVGDDLRKGVDTVRSFARETDRDVYVVGDVADPNVRSFDRVSPDRLAELYSGAVATIHPAKFEAFGNVVLESLACGTPVVTTSQCGASEVIDETVGTVDVPVADGIRQVRTLRERDCVERAREHTWGRVAGETEAVLQTLLDERHD